MTKIDLLPYNIRIILDPSKISICSKYTPWDIEGTVCSVVYYTRTAFKMINEGKILELLSLRGEASVQIRWDNDVRIALSSGHFIFRRAKIGYCESIWDDNYHLPFDNRPHHELKPKTIPEDSLSGPLNYTNPTTEMPFQKWKKKGKPIGRRVSFEELSTRATEINEVLDSYMPDPDYFGEIQGGNNEEEPGIINDDPAPEPSTSITYDLSDDGVSEHQYTTTTDWKTSFFTKSNDTLDSYINVPSGGLKNYTTSYIGRGWTEISSSN